MIRQTVFAQHQADALFDHYLDKGYEQAYENLMMAIAEAAERIEADPADGLPHPRPYPGMARWGFRWIKVHNYWFGWSMTRGYPLVTNVFYVTSRMWARVAPDEGEEVPFQGGRR